MIIGNKDGTSPLFREINDAVEALAGDRVVHLCAHDNPEAVPRGGIVYNLENVPGQVDTDMFQGCELWDFSERNCEAWRKAGRGVTHVPVGYHPSMERFTMKPWEERDIDVIFTGVLNERRVALLNELGSRGLKVEVIYPGPGSYGPERDEKLSRAKLAIAPLYYPDGIYGTLRAAHCAANGLPLISETAPDMPPWVGAHCCYEELAELVAHWLKSPNLRKEGELAYERFVASPMTLPASKLSPWRMLREKRPADWDLEAMYDEARGGPVSPTPCVRIIVPSYREGHEVYLRTEPSRTAVVQDLVDHGIEVMRAGLDGDSLPTRMRQRASHHAMRSTATHFLWWDLDIEALDPTCVRKMLATGHDVVAGACPFRDGTGRTVHNLWPGTFERWEKEGCEMPMACVDVMDAGTGFMLVSRRATAMLQKAHPELLHWSRSKDDFGEPLWSLYREGIFDEPGSDEPVSKSEDYHLCKLWQNLGEKVYVYAPAKFRHFGLYGHEGSFLEQYGMEPKVA